MQRIAKTTGFTLIESISVVAISEIFRLVAIPDFLNSSPAPTALTLTPASQPRSHRR